MPENGAIIHEGESFDSETITFSSVLSDTPELIRPMRASRWKEALKNVSIEPLMFLHMFGVASTGVIVQDLYIQRICTVTLGHSLEECQNLSHIVDGDEEASDLERHVDALASKFSLYRQLIETVIPIIFALFLGSWSDKHGSKFPLLLPIFGYVLSAGSYTFFTFLPDLKPEYILMSSIPVSLSGGMVAIVLSSFSFISTLTTNENRSFRIAILEACWFTGMPLGLLTGARIYKVLGFAPVFMNAALFFGVALFYGLVFVREEKPEIPPDNSDCFKDMFNVQSVKETFWTVFREREPPRRLWILLLIATVCLRIMTLFGPNNCMYLFVRYQFSWSEQEFSTLTTIESVLGVVGGISMTIMFVKIWKLSDSLIGLLSCFGFVIANVLVAFAPRGHEHGWIMYLAAVVQMFGGMTTIVIRSMISKIVPKQELAKVFTFVACGEAAVPIIANALYSLIFIESEKSFAGAFSLLSAGINFWVLCHFIYFFISTRKNPEILELEEEPDAVIN